MKKIDVIYSSKIDKDISITYDSDIHYDKGMRLDYLYRQLHNLENDPTTYYFLLGDIVNDSKIDKEDLKELRDVLAKIAATGTKVYAILGNHDQVTKSETGDWIECYNCEYVDMFRNINGFNLLENECVCDNNIVICGTRFPSSYYYTKGSDVHEPIDEYVNTMRKALNYGEIDTFNILLDHSPYHAFDSSTFDLIPNLSETDAIFSGHFHNGLVPCYIDKVLPGNFGIIAYRKLLPKNVRGKKQINDDTVGFVSSPITTFAGHYRGLQKLNAFYPPMEQKVLVKSLR